MIFLGIFLIELFILFLTSKALINSIARLVYIFTKSREVAIHTIAFLFLPGTIIHELSHIISAGVLMVHTGAIEFIPQIHEDGVKLGTAEIGKTDPIRRSLIGVAPVIVGLGIILGLLFFFSNSVLSGGMYSIWIYLLIFYAIFVIGNTMFSSKKDLEGSALVIVLIISTLVALYLLGFNQIFSWFSNSINNIESYVKNAAIFLTVPIGINLLLIVVSKILRS